MVFDREGAGTK